MFQIDLDATFPHLANAPIVEAVVNWQAHAGEKWNFDVFRSRFARSFPDYPSLQSEHGVHVQAAIERNDVSGNVRAEPRSGLRLVSADRLHVVRVARDGLTFSRLAPYTDWEGFSAEALRFWELFLALAGPLTVDRLGIRFINRIDIHPARSVDAYLRHPPASPVPFGLPLDEYFFRTTHTIPGQPVKLTVNQATQRASHKPPATHSLIVDIDVYSSSPMDSGGDIRARMTQMRWVKNKVFFGLFSDEALASFG